MSHNHSVSSMTPPLLVLVCCAQWCGVCRDFKQPLRSLASRLPSHQFVWIDIEDTDLWEDEVDIENFPTVVVVDQMGKQYFCGPIEPHIKALQKLVETFEADGSARPVQNDLIPLIEKIKNQFVQTSNNFLDLA
ncbi:MAG: thioredoxin family protein [Limnobacter sp.]|nr:thioredoxin family protein [Limnobacter sp.]